MGPNTIAKVGIWSHSKQKQCKSCIKMNITKKFFIQSESSEQEPQQQSHTHTHTLVLLVWGRRCSFFEGWGHSPCWKHRQLYSYYSFHRNILSWCWRSEGVGVVSRRVVTVLLSSIHSTILYSYTYLWKFRFILFRKIKASSRIYKAYYNIHKIYL